MKTSCSAAALAAAVSSLLGAQAPAQYAVEAEGDDANACAALRDLELPDVVSLEAQAVAPGPFDVPASGPAPARTVELPAFCRVRGVVSPAITFEVWLPEGEAWNGRFQAVGGGGFAGVISYSAMAPALTSGYVTASTDTGHVAPDVEWLGDPGRRRDYGYRAIYEMTTKSKALIRAFYEKAPDYSYFNGCSTGGRQGLMEAQRFAGDYDGIVSGAPVNYFVATHFTQLWTALAAKERSDESILSDADLELVNAAVVDQCDALDGVRDGVLEDPRTCTFEPSSLQCSATGSSECLSADQVTALERIYAGPVHAVTGESLHPGLAPGGETTWSVVSASGLVQIPREYFGRAVFEDPSWDWRTFDFAGDVERAYRATGEILDATDADLSDFRDSGGKLIVYHGWNDQVIFPEGTIAYYESVDAAMAERPNAASQDKTDFFRLFMVPGMTHCRGGVGTDRFDAQSAIEAWVERGIAPDRIEASRVEDGAVTRTRPLCPYPQTARYDGTGDTNDTANFVCAE